MVKTLATDSDLKNITVWEINDAQSVLSIAALVLEGELEGKAKNYEASIALFEKAIALETSLNYNEPSDWHYPARQSLGAVLLDAKQYSAAEQVYLADLAVFPKNGWSLYGLQQALLGQGKKQKAKAIGKQFEQSWQWADIALNASRIL